MSVAVDIAVVGAGAAGIAAAITAARTGASVLLLDQRAAAGGTGGYSGLTTLCGLFDDQGKYLNDGFAREFASALAENPPQQMGKVWVQWYRPETFRVVAAEMIAARPNVEPRWNNELADVRCRGQRITHLNGIAVGAVIDCSGMAEVARAIGAEWLATDETTQSSAIVFPLQGVTREFRTAVEVVNVLLPLARAGFAPLNLQPTLEPGSFTAKFAGRPEQVIELLAFLRAKVGGFENATTPVTEFVPARRAGRMIVGRYLLTGAEVLAGQTFPDAVAKCAWPIEQWDAQGAVRFKYLPARAHYEIPARCLCAAKVENLYMAGKTLSADANAIASARVMGCCLATGAAAGQLAAAYLQSRRI